MMTERDGDVRDAAPDDDWARTVRLSYPVVPMSQRIDGEALRVILRDVVKGSSRSPSPAAVALLAERLGGIAVRIHRWRGAWGAREEARSRLFLSLDEVRERVAAARVVLQCDAEGDDRDLNDIAKMQLAALDNLEASMSIVRDAYPPSLVDIWGPSTKPNKGARKEWHSICADVANMFVEAMRSTNGSYRPGLASDGPVAKFLVAVVKKITGERVSEGTMVKHLTRIGWKAMDNPG